jgi:L-alanine-DL-glutamate epimerase-like enolase superfamily enzyme
VWKSQKPRRATAAAKEEEPTFSKTKPEKVGHPPGDVAASRRYWDEDIIEPEVTVSAQGTIRVPTGPGIGFEPRRERIEKLTVRKERLV